jgi:DNA-binding NtrC family response regulator
VPSSAASSRARLDGAGDAAEREQIEHAIARADGVISRAASDLGLSRQALYRRMERLGMAVERRVRPPSEP